MKTERGYIALISAIVISLVLTVMGATMSMSGYFSRFNMLDAELHQKSLTLAEACADTALLRLARDPSYSGNDTVAVEKNSCHILAIPPQSGGRITITTKAVVDNIVTNIQVIATTPDLSITSWLEIPTVP